MAKHIIREPGRTYQEFSLLTGLTKRDCSITTVGLETKLHDNLVLKIPLVGAAMMSVTGYEMALALGKEGGIGVLPVRLPVDVQADIVKRIKNYEMAFVQEPVTVRENVLIEEALREIKRHGHSKIPVCDITHKFVGMFDQPHYWKTSAGPGDLVTKAMIPLKDVPYVCKPDITVDEAKQAMDERKENYLVVLNQDNTLVKLAFKKDEAKIKVAAAISTHEGWQQRVEANAEQGVDLISIDTSDAFNEFTSDVVKHYKAMKLSAPLCAGNIITYEGAMYLMSSGADIIKVGMSSGSICTTKREKSVGRAPMTALMDVDRARKDFLKTTGKYVPIIADGGITSSADMIIALTLADAVMLGGYLNQFYEAAGEKFNEHGKVTTDENAMKEVATWGEGSERAQNLDRYGHSTRKTFFAEGEEGTKPYLGRLKPHLKQDLLKIRAALVNAGCYTLADLRKNAVIELNSQFSNTVIGDTHNMRVKK
ncbi:MAG TPA: IMP dehydrogenase [Candidatus Binatia bacterium]|nr:IMP dehydrogenase [Candidatus Binatia bacterium]